MVGKRAVAVVSWIRQTHCTHELIAMVTSIRPTLLTECLNPHSEEPSQSLRPLCFFPKLVPREYGRTLYYESILSWSTRTQEEGKLKQITSR